MLSDPRPGAPHRQQEPQEAGPPLPLGRPLAQPGRPVCPQGLLEHGQPLNRDHVPSELEMRPGGLPGRCSRRSCAQASSLCARWAPGQGSAKPQGWGTRTRWSARGCGKVQNPVLCLCSKTTPTADCPKLTTDGARFPSWLQGHLNVLWQMQLKSSSTIRFSPF